MGGREGGRKGGRGLIVNAAITKKPSRNSGINYQLQSIPDWAMNLPCSRSRLLCLPSVNSFDIIGEIDWDEFELKLISNLAPLEQVEASPASPPFPPPRHSQSERAFLSICFVYGPFSSGDAVGFVKRALWLVGAAGHVTWSRLGSSPVSSPVVCLYAPPMVSPASIYILSSYLYIHWLVACVSTMGHRLISIFTCWVSWTGVECDVRVHARGR